MRNLLSTAGWLLGIIFASAKPLIVVGTIDPNVDLQALERALLRIEKPDKELPPLAQEYRLEVVKSGNEWFLFPSSLTTESPISINKALAETLLEVQLTPGKELRGEDVPDRVREILRQRLIARSVDVGLPSPALEALDANTLLFTVDIMFAPRVVVGEGRQKTVSFLLSQWTPERVAVQKEMETLFPEFFGPSRRSVSSSEDEASAPSVSPKQQETEKSVMMAFLQRHYRFSRVHLMASRLLSPEEWSSVNQRYWQYLSERIQQLQTELRKAHRDLIAMYLPKQADVPVAWLSLADELRVPFSQLPSAWQEGIRWSLGSEIDLENTVVLISPSSFHFVVGIGYPVEERTTPGGEPFYRVGYIALSGW